MTFFVGQKVVCVDDDWFGPDDLPLHMLDFVKCVPIKGSIYRVRDVDNATPAYIRLAEIINPMPPEPQGEVHFSSTYFRPVIETDISIFERMLIPSDRKMKERV